MYRINRSKKTALGARPTPAWLTIALACFATVLSLPVNAAIAIPDVPLQAGTAVPPNIMFILDDSGSMTWDFMPDSVPQTAPLRIASRAFTRNGVFYNPNVNYQRWSKPDGNLFPDTPATAAFTNNDLVEVGTTNLLGSSHVFMAPKTGATNLADSRQYLAYQLLKDDTSNARECTDFTVSGGELNDPSRTTITPTDPIEKSCKTITSFTWPGPGADGKPITRTVAEEWHNFALWYSYHRTRMKAAKAGASAAFAGLSSDLRVGYDTINRNIGGRLDVPVTKNDGLFEDNNGSTNRTDWFNRLYAARGSNSTPLRNALKRTGEYFMDAEANGPWGPEGGANQLACRQNFAILTTDGFWNGGDPGVGNVDGTDGDKITGPAPDPTDPKSVGPSFTYTAAPPFSDGASNTLADVAMNYWKNDLRPGMDNIVPTSNLDPAFWQHMVTFSLSIGAGGTLDPTDATLQQIKDGAIKWPTPAANALTTIDDLWHASVNGHGTFVAAGNPQKFADGLKNALAAIVERAGSSSNVATNSVSIGTETKLFQANFVAGQWTGDVFAFPVTSTTDADGNKTSKVGSTLLWRASQGIPVPSQRRLYTHNGSAGVEFTFANLSPSQKTALDNAAVLDYLRGDTSGERRNGGTFRNRNSVLGDIINSSPAFVKDTNTVYVGANDGMLHAFNANTGAEVFGYVPDGTDWAQLKTLTDPDYAHRYFVDGAVIVSNREQTPGKNILVGALGRGGKGIYVLDVTTPSSFSGSDVEWRDNGADNDMGQVLGTPIIAKLNNGDTGVIVANGINSTSQQAALFVFDITTGKVLAKINTGAGSATNSNDNNGLSTPRGWDADGNGTLDFVYAGDLLGNVWKFDLSDAQENKWDVANNDKPLFVAKDKDGNTQPITGGMSVALHPVDFSTWVFFGTGRFLSAGDLANKDTQSMYGLIDAGATITGRADLMEREIVSLGSNSSKVVRGFEPADDLASGKKGWYIDMLTPPSATAEGERIVSNVAVIGRVLLTASIIPSDDPCQPGGRGFINALDAFTGASVDTAFFDVNGNGVFTDDTIGGSPIGSVDLGVGMPTTPAVIDTLLVAGGSLGTVGSVAVSNPSNTGRISWREVIGD